MPNRRNKKFENLFTRRNYGLYERANNSETSLVNASAKLNDAEKIKSNRKLAKLFKNNKRLITKLNLSLLKPKSFRINYRRVKSGALATLLIFSIVVPFLPTEFAKAATATVLPDGDVTTQWAGQATPHWSKIDEDVLGTIDTADFIATGGPGTSGASAAEEFTFGTVANVASASSVIVRINSKSQTNANGGTLDDLDVQLRIGGSLQTAQRITPAYHATTGTYPTTSTLTFNGNWTQANIDGMQVLVTRVTQGSGNPTNQQDDVRIAAVSADVIYTSVVNFEQSAYRWLDNADSGLSDVTSWKQVSTNTGLGSNSSGIENTAVFNNKMWTIGPVYGSSKNVYSSTNGINWTLETSTAPWEIQRSDMSSLAYNSKLWMIGGDNGDDTNQVYSSSDGITWTQETAAAGWAVRGNYPETVFNNKMWIFGGWDDISNLWYNDVWSSSDGITWTQETAAAGWSARRSHQVTVFNGKLWIFGGRNSAGSSLNDVWSSSDGITWTQETAAAGWSARYKHSAVSYNGYMWVMGGQNSTPTYNNEIWRSTDGINWTQVSNSSWSARQGAGLYSYDSRLWIVQGAGSSQFTDAWHTVGPGIDVGSPLSALSTPTTLVSEGTIIRLRLNLHASIGNAEPDSSTFKLQYAQRGVDNLCDTSFANETFSDLSSSSGVIRYANNSIAYDSQPIATNINDPTHSGHTVTPQSYEEANNFTVTNTITNGSDGMWDFALVDYNAPASTTYCFRVVRSTGTQLTTYSVVPQITTATSSLDQSSYRWFENAETNTPITLASAWGGTSNEYTLAVTQTSDGGYATTGYTSSFTAGGDDLTLVKYTNSGEEEWSKTVGGGSNDRGHAIVQTQDGGYAVAGQTASYGGGGLDQILVKFNSSGVEQWTKSWGGSGGEEAVGLVELSDGSLVTAGYSSTAAYTAGLADATIIKYSSSGIEQWSKTWGGANTDVGIVINKSTDNGFVISGYQSSYSAGGIDQFLVKFDNSGIEQWSKTWGGAGEDRVYGMSNTSDGGYVTAGYTNSYGAGNFDQSLVKYDSSGVEQWSKTWGGSGDDRAYAVTETSDGGFAVTGYSASHGAGAQDHTLVKYNSSGVEQWSKTWGGTGNELSRAVIEVANNYLLSVGTTASRGAGVDDQLVLLFDNNGTIANCGPSLCQDITITETDVTIVEADRSVTEFNVVITEGDHAVVETDRTAASVQTYIAGHLTFSHLLGGAASEGGNAITQTSDGGYAVAGYTYSYGSGQADILLSKFRANGIEEWSKTLGTTGDDRAYSLKQTTDGGYILTGSGPFGAGGSDQFISKFNSSGVEQWTKSIGNTGTDVGFDVIEMPDAGFIVTGYTDFYGAGGFDTLITKYNSSGVEQWSKTWGGSLNDNAGGITKTSDGGFVISGWTLNYGAGGQDQVLVKFNSSGIEQWSKTWGSTGNDAAVSVFEAGDNSLYVAGNTASYGAGGDDISLVKYNSSGVEQWSKTWGGAGSDTTMEITETTDGGIVIVGITTSYGAGGNDIVIIKYNSLGTALWSKAWGGTGDEYEAGVVATADGGIVVTGTSNSYGAGAYDAIVLKYDINGVIKGCSSTPCNNLGVAESNVDITESDQTVTEADQAITETNQTLTEVDQTASTTLTVSNAVLPWDVMSISPGSALSNVDSRLENITRSNPYRLRMTQHVGGKQVGATSLSLKLQAAPKVGTCDTSFTGEQYSDVTGVSALKYYTGNIVATDGAQIAINANDPSHNGHANVLQTYESANNITNLSAILVGQDGLWDLALYVDDDILGGSFCLRMVHSSGTPLSSYSVIPEIFIPPKVSQQLRHGRFFSAGQETQPFRW